jgi:hypothetical protein
MAQLDVCAWQSFWLCALAHEAANFSSHLVSLAASAARPVFWAAAYTLSLQLTFLATAFVMPASQRDCACAMPPTMSDSIANPPTTSDLSMCPPL